MKPTHRKAEWRDGEGYIPGNTTGIILNDDLSPVLPKATGVINRFVFFYIAQFELDFCYLYWKVL